MAHSQSKHRSGTYLSSLSSISLVLLLVGFATLMLLGAGSIKTYFQQTAQATVIFKQTAQPMKIQAYQQWANLQPYIKKTNLVSAEQGRREMAEMLGEDFLEAFGLSRIPVSLEVVLSPGWYERIGEVVAELEASPIVDEVDCKKGMIDVMNSNLDRISMIIAAVMLALIFVSVVLIGGTVRQSVYTHRFSVYTMQLVGATKGFIMRPFIKDAVRLGLAGSAVATVCMAALLYLVNEKLFSIMEVFTVPILLETLGIVVVVGITICAVTTRVVVRKLSTMKKEELYGR